MSESSSDLSPSPADQPAQLAQSGSSPEVMPPEVAKEIRRLTHDLSNALEILVQTSYLLGLAELKEPASEWLRMLEGGVTKATEINSALRSYIREHSPR